MITGRQIREARPLLGNGETLRLRARIDDSTLTRAEAVDSEPSITAHDAILIQQAFERAGIHFGKNGVVMRLDPRRPLMPPRYPGDTERLATNARRSAEAAFRKATTKPIEGPAAAAIVPDAREQVTLRIDQAVLEHFQADGSGWQDRINEALRKFVKESASQ